MDTSDNFCNFAAKINVYFNLLKIMVKKYLIGSFAVLAAMTLTTSCGNEDAFDASKDLDVANYEAAFVRTFGTPSPNQTWGFGDATSTTRTIDPTFWNAFPSAPDDSEYAQVKDGNAKLLTGYQQGNLFYINSSVSQNNQTLQPYVAWDAENKDIVLYVEGEVVPSDIYTPANTTIYLLPNSKLTIPASRNSFNQNYTKIYIAENAELIILGDQVEFGSGVSVYNKGKITAQNIVVSNNGLLYNQNLIDIPGKIKITNGESVVVNDGTINANYLGTEGSAHFQNNNTVTISDETRINSNNNTWVNNEQYTTKYFNYTAGSSDVINNCKLTVTEKFYINLGQNSTSTFRMDSNCGVVAKNFEAAGPARIYMGSNSVFKVNNEANMNITLDNWGIYGPESGDYAVFQAKDIVNGATDPNQGFVACYFNNLYVVAETHFAQGYSDKSAAQQAAGEIGNQPYYKLANGAALYQDGDKPGITIVETTCNPGFGGGDEFTPVIRVMAEDLTASQGSDFDFNDVVFDVQWTSTGAKIRLNAAGGTLPLTIEGIEVHEKFAEFNPGRGITTKSMINTYEGHKADFIKPIFEITGNFQQNAKNIIILVNKGTVENPKWIELKAEKGKIAEKFGVDPKVDWCEEQRNIEEKYSNFGKWVRGAESFY